MKKTKQQVVCRLHASVMTISALIGTTFAWFTDTVSSNGNIITSGNLDAEMYWSDELLAADSDEWQDANGTPVFNYNNWEPGYTEVRYVKVSNAGSLNFRWKLTIEADGEVTDLSDVINVYYVNPVTAELTKDALAALTPTGTLTDVLDNKTSIEGRQLTPGSSQILAIAFHMDELAGNDYQKKALCEGGFSLKLLATQDIGESDSYGDDYDLNAEWPYTGIKYHAAEPIANDKIDTTTGALTESVSIGNEGDIVTATIPNGVKLADGATEVVLSVESMTNSQANVQINEEEETKVSLDVHIDGISEDNNVPMEIKLKGVAPKGYNDNSIQFYHVDNGVTVQMTQIGMSDAFTAHNQFKYDAVTGDVILYMASFSEVAMVTANVDHWDGKSATSFSGGSGTEADPYLIANASQLAYFRDIVDGKVEWDGDRTFKGQYVKLANDVILNHQGETSNQFDPIGWGYDNAAYNRNGADGKVFMGTFDGNRHGIHGLWQNGWDLESMTGTDYTYTNCGFGLFASVKDATIKNLEIKHANVTVECVEAGVLVGLAQGSCTFENIMIYQSQIANYQRPAGGVVGEVSPGFDAEGNVVESNHRFINVNVGSSCTVGSLWGDFDTPCGGVIGAYWDDTSNTTVYMEDVDVSCVLDVYNDVTAAYQWYAYRRAGMLIGNTDRPAADGKNAQIAAAPFLTCKNCVVIYDWWTDYYYCEFTNDNNPGNGYPWVRIQGGQYNGAYSNPRYGHPVDELGNTVITDDHKHKDGDTCHEYIPFNQLYGGGQGVYGQSAHPGVTIGKYVVVYMEGDEIYDVKYVADNVDPFNDFLELESGYDWIDMNGNHYTKGGDNKIPAGNTTDYVLYKNTINTRMIRFVDSRGFVISEQNLPKIDKSSADANYYKTFYESKLTIPDVPRIDGYVGVWPEWWKMIKETPADQDVAIHAVYTIVYEDPDVVPDEDEIEILDETGDMGDLFQMISQGKSVVMYKPLSGNIGNASKVTFATVAATEKTSKVDGWVSPN
ncbi:MAG: SipW-dependent-type signal peptide-containing protein, partial [Clostridia bacterium]|nr:SipW-dependent-type signal peptide-containing protein [Clostridia bacterium]